MMQTVAWIASALVFATFYMRDQVRMRQMAVLANITFICYALLGLENGIFDKVLPIFVLHVSSLALNLKRLREAMATKGGCAKAFATKAWLLLMSGVLSVTTQAHVPAIADPEGAVVKSDWRAPVAEMSKLVRQVPSSDWQWPLTGTVQKTFGSNRNKGIVITADKAQSVRAAASGRVVYSGNGLPGYGNLIILQHKNGYQSIYGLNSTIFVKEGELVQRGHEIAMAGVVMPQEPGIHFEIRRHGKALDPCALIQCR